MEYKSNSRRRAIEYEKDLVQEWKKQKVFEESIQFRPLSKSYVFYDGPPFITGVPHHGTLLSSIVKDAIPRYQTMKGNRVERVWGWDCHGLPAENFVEKKLGIASRQEIGKKVSLEKYIQTARESMVETGNLWEDTIDRIGRWVDFKGAYRTMDKNYMESVWWAFKTLYEKGKIYEGEKVLLYDTQWATPLSKAEVTQDSDAYVEVTDPSVYVKFQLLGGEQKQYLLAWTTTPWTLPANVALAINPNFIYTEVEVAGERLILAQDTLDKVLVDNKHQPLQYKVLQTIKGKDLVGRSYVPLFANHGERAHRVWGADYVTIEDGTGIVHTAPAYGEDDFSLSQKNKIPVVHVIDEYGNFTETEWQGQNIWDVNKLIAKTLLERGVVWKIDYIRHEYPHNPRTGKRLIYRAHPSWFYDIDSQRAEMIEFNKKINWFPKHIKEGRFKKTIETAPDWNLSRDRFWATAMPVWKGVDDKGQEKIKVVGSYAELKELSGIELDDYHRPWVDEIEFDLDGVHYKRVDKVLDCWFESGSMPFAQFHYPFENVEKFEANFPGDFIVEYVGQVRAWFYYMHAISVGLFGSQAFKNVIVTGTISGNDGRKMSKSLKNYTDPNELMDKFSADSYRFLLLSCPLLNGEDFSLQDKDVGDIARKLSMIWNIYDFFTMYAEVDNWTFNGALEDPVKISQNPLDRWIASRLHQLIKEMTVYLDGYDLPNALRLVLPFIEDASNWYVRRSRRRFWKSDDDNDKEMAYKTLHYVLTQFSKIMAPFTPFLAEELYQKMTGQKSVHLVDWPKPGVIDQAVLDDMALVRGYVTEGLNIRATQGQRVRQPLASVTVPALSKIFNAEDILKDELNVKKVIVGENLALDLELTPELVSEGNSREIIRHIQALRKQAGFNVDDRINLALITKDKALIKTIEDYEKNICQETLSLSLSRDAIDGASSTVSIEKAELVIIVVKA